MKNKKKIKFICEEVMMWKYWQTDSVTKEIIWKTKDKNSPTFRGFDPYENWNHCGMMIEGIMKFHGNGILFAQTMYDRTYISSVQHNEGISRKATHEKPTHAICEAVLKAYGYKPSRK